MLFIIKYSRGVWLFKCHCIGVNSEFQFIIAFKQYTWKHQHTHRIGMGVLMFQLYYPPPHHPPPPPCTCLSSPSRLLPQQPPKVGGGGGRGEEGQSEGGHRRDCTRTAPPLRLSRVSDRAEKRKTACSPEAEISLTDTQFVRGGGRQCHPAGGLASFIRTSSDICAKRARKSEVRVPERLWRVFLKPSGKVMNASRSATNQQKVRREKKELWRGRAKRCTFPRGRRRFCPPLSFSFRQVLIPSPPPSLYLPLSLSPPLSPVFLST